MWQGTPLFEQARRGAVRLQVRGIDHDPFWLGTFTRRGGEDAVEYAQ
jgi:hypothetical protein